MKEAQIHQAVIQHWRQLQRPNTLVATLPNYRAFGQPGLTPGLPDLLVITPVLGVGFIELKREGGRLSKAQKSFVELCDANSIPMAVTYGRDAPIQQLEEWNVVRRLVA